jgi:hypothetical protein
MLYQVNIAYLCVWRAAANEEEEVQHMFHAGYRFGQGGSKLNSP